MISFKEFCRLAIQSPNLFDGIPLSDYNAMGDRLGIAVGHKLERTDLLSALKERIKPYLALTLKSDSMPSKDWRRMAFYQCVLEFNSEPSAALQVLEALHYYGYAIAGSLSEESWIDLISTVKAISMIDPIELDKDQFSEHNDNYIRAIAAVRLRECGATISYETGWLDIEEGEVEIVAQIEAIIEKYGGIVWMAIWLGGLKNFFDVQFNRYILPTAPSSHFGPKKAILPIAFLLNLCAKYLFVKVDIVAEGKVAELEGDMLLVQRIATDLLSVWGGQRYNIWREVFLELNELPYYLQQTMTFDACVHFPQSDFATEVADCLQLFSWVENQRFEDLHGFSVSQYLSVCGTLGRISANVRGLVRIDKENLAKTLVPRLSLERIDLILAQLSHKPEEVNQGFVTPVDYRKVNVQERPLMRSTKRPATEYIILDHNWSAQGIFETLLGLARRAYGKSASSEVGRSFEDLVTDQFRIHGIAGRAGKFKYQGKYGECDLLVEAERVILLLEIKKTALSHDALSGQDYHILASLGETVVKALQQAGKIEQILREQGYIDLQNRRGVVDRVQWNGRRIYRIAVTHRDFYSLMDHTFIDRLNTILFDAQVELKEEILAAPGVIDRMKKLNRSLLELKDQYARIHRDPDGVNADRPYLDCHFLSLPMLRILLNGVVDVEGFLKNFDIVRHKTFGSGNFYLEFRAFQNAQANPDAAPQFVLHKVDGSFGRNGQ